MNKLVYIAIIIFLGIPLKVLSEGEYLFPLSEKKIIISEEQLNKAVEIIRSGKASEYTNTKGSHFGRLQQVEDGIVSNISKPESEIHAAINPLDPQNIIVSPILQDGSNPLQSLALPVYYTLDGGETWEVSDFIGNPGKANSIVAGGGDPVFVFDKNGRAYMSWINIYLTTSQVSIDSIGAKIFWAYSDDKGKTWQRAEKDYFTGQMSEYGGMASLDGLDDKQWMASDYSDSPYSGNVYASFISIAEAGFNPYVVTKEPGKTIFNEEKADLPTDDATYIQFITIGTDNEGTVHAAMYASDGGSNNRFIHSRSINGGKDFLPANEICKFRFFGSELMPSETGVNSDTIPGITKARFYPSPHLAVDNSGTDYSGNLYYVFSADGINQNDGNGKEIYFTRSVNKGSNWSEPVSISDDANRESHQFYPSITVNENGVVIVTYYGATGGKTSDQTDYYMTASFDGGLTFSNPLKINTVSTKFSTTGSQNGGFGIGEYCQVVANSDYAFAFWADGRKSNGDLDVYFAKISIDPDSPLLSVEHSGTMFDGASMSIFPNPAKDIISVKMENFSTEIHHFSLVDITGKTVLDFGRINPAAGSPEFDLGGVAPGNYYLIAESENGITAKKLIVK
jgi:hypothetical protein